MVCPPPATKSGSCESVIHLSLGVAEGSARDDLDLRDGDLLIVQLDNPAEEVQFDVSLGARDSLVAWMWRGLFQDAIYRIELAETWQRVPKLGKIHKTLFVESDKKQKHAGLLLTFLEAQFWG